MAKIPIGEPAAIVPIVLLTHVVIAQTGSAKLGARLQNTILVPAGTESES